MIATGKQVSTIEALLKLFDNSPDSPELKSAHEHIESARTYVQGSMPEEYKFSLQMAREAIGAIPQAGVREKAEELFKQLLEENPS
jgi:hypothetical protein